MGARCLLRTDNLLISLLQSNQDSDPPSLTIGEGLPHVHGKLVTRIQLQSGHFIDLAELILGVVTAYEEEDKAKHHSKRYKTVTNFLERVQCFGIYTSVFSKSQPKWVANLVGYQTLIIQVLQSSYDNNWLG